jgi:hypothetical protein
MRLKNLVVQDGLDYHAQSLVGQDARDVNYIAIGSDGSDTTLSMSSLQGTEHTRKQVTAANQSFPSSDEAQQSVVIPTTEPAGQPVDIGEIGLFASTKGDAADFMYARVGFPTFEKTQDIEIRIFYTIGFSNP